MHARSRRHNSCRDGGDRMRQRLLPPGTGSDGMERGNPAEMIPFENCPSEYTVSYNARFKNVSGGPKCEQIGACPKWFVVTALTVEIGFFEGQSALTPKGGFRSRHTANRTLGLSGQPQEFIELRK